MALFQGDLVDAQGRQAAERLPIHALPKVVRDDVLHFVVTYFLLFTDILNRAVDQEFQNMLRIRPGDGVARFVPRQALRGGGIDSPGSHGKYSGAA